MGDTLKGDVIQKLRLQVGLSPQQFADAIGVERPRVVQIEQGKPTTVKAAVFTKMVEVLKTKPPHLPAYLRFELLGQRRAGVGASVFARA